MEFWHGKTGGWTLIGESADEGVQDKCCCPFFDIKLIQIYPQAEGVKLHILLIGN